MNLSSNIIATAVSFSTTVFRSKSARFIMAIAVSFSGVGALAQTPSFSSPAPLTTQQSVPSSDDLASLRKQADWLKKVLEGYGGYFINGASRPIEGVQIDSQCNLTLKERYIYKPDKQDVIYETVSVPLASVTGVVASGYSDRLAAEIMEIYTGDSKAIRSWGQSWNNGERNPHYSNQYQLYLGRTPETSSTQGEVLQTPSAMAPLVKEALLNAAGICRAVHLAPPQSSAAVTMNSQSSGPAKSMSASDITSMLEGAKSKKLKGGSWAIKHCNKNDDHDTDTGRACAEAAIAFDNGDVTKLSSDEASQLELALQRACAFPSTYLSVSPCAELAELYAKRGEYAMAFAVGLYAPNCNNSSLRLSEEREACLSKAWEAAIHLAHLKSIPNPELVIVTELCRKFSEPHACSRFNQLGGTADVGVAQQAHDAIDRADFDRIQKDGERQNERNREASQMKRERDEQFAATLQSLSGSPNAILNAGNEQAAQLRAIGAANDAARQQAAHAQSAAQQVAAQQSAQAQLEQAQARQQQQAAAAQQPGQQQAQQGPSVTEGELIKSADSPDVYVVQGGQRHHVPDPAALQAKWGGNMVYTVPQSTIDGIPLGDPIPAVAASNFCSPPTSTQQPPPHKDPVWGPWQFLGSTGVAISVTRVDSKTLSWEFFNARPDKITSLNFNYTYVDADSGQNTTQKDLVPITLKPGDALGGWTAYTANTRGNVYIQITQMSCQ